MKREELKALIKECIVEVLQEGVTSTKRGIQEGRDLRPIASAPTAPAPIRKTINGMSLDRPALPQAQRTAPAPRPNQVNRAVAGLTRDPVLSAIFADTATNTLAEQAQAERMGPVIAGDAASVRMSQADPVDLFGGAAANWAAYAFADKIE